LLQICPFFLHLAPSSLLRRIQANFNDQYCYCLDAGTELYVWQGKRSFGSVRLQALRFAKDMAAYASEIRGKEVDSVEVFSGAEPQVWTHITYALPRCVF
jgi:hypothetical protein